MHLSGMGVGGNSVAEMQLDRKGHHIAAKVTKVTKVTKGKVLVSR